MTTLFVYGSLMAEEVLQTLLGRVPVSVGAFLGGYFRYSIAGFQYPIISQTKLVDNVKGRLLYDINPLEMRILDLFEGDEYTRTNVIAHTEDGKQVNAAVYVATQDTFTKFTPHLSNEWDYERFRKDHMVSFLVMCKTFKDELK